MRILSACLRALLLELQRKQLNLRYAYFFRLFETHFFVNAFNFFVFCCKRAFENFVYLSDYLHFSCRRSTKINCLNENAIRNEKYSFNFESNATVSISSIMNETKKSKKTNKNS